MSQKMQKVFSRKSEPKELTDEELKREIFANLPLDVFRKFTNIRTLIAEKYRQLQDGKDPTTFYMNRKTENLYKSLSKTEVHDAILKELEFIGSKSDEDVAKVWLRGKREQKHIYAHSTKQQKKFLYLPKNVLCHATNFVELVRAAASEHGEPQPSKFVDEVFNNLPQIDHWIPALSNLKFLDTPNAPPIDKNDDDERNPNSQPDENTPLSGTNTPRRPQKRKNRKANTDDDTVSELSSQPAKRRRSVRLQSKDVNDENDESQAATAKIKRESKIPLVNPKRKSNASEMVFLGPNDFQLKVQDLNVEAFAAKTNIKAIILDEYRAEVRDVNANIPRDEMTKRLLDYNSKRMDSRQWKRTGLTRLKFVDENKFNQSLVTPQRSTANAPTPPTAPNSGDKKPSEINNDDKTHLKSSVKPIEPNHFQKEVMSMSYETFINETNAKELVRTYLESEAQPMTDAQMEIELKKLDEQRYHLRRYHKGLLNHLKFLKCECQRNKTFQDKWTQTDAIPSQDTEVQCDLFEASTSKATAPTKNEQLHTPCQSKLSMLTVHEITDAEVIQMESVSSTSVADSAWATEPPAALIVADHAHPLTDTGLDSSEPRIEMPQEIEDILAALENDDNVKENPGQITKQQAQTEIIESTVDHVQPDSSADAMIIHHQETVMADESVVSPQSEVDEYTVECEVISEVSEQHVEQPTSADVDSLVDKANNFDSETPMQLEEYLLKSTKPTNVSGEHEPIPHVEIPCPQTTTNIVDANAGMTVDSNEHSYAQEQLSNTSSELVDSFHVNSFEPKEKSTPKSMEAKSTEIIHQTPRQPVKKEPEIKKLPNAVQRRARNPLETIIKMKRLIDGIYKKDPGAIGLCEKVFKDE